MEQDPSPETLYTSLNLEAIENSVDPKKFQNVELPLPIMGCLVVLLLVLVVPAAGEGAGGGRSVGFA